MKFKYRQSIRFWIAIITLNIACDLHRSNAVWIWILQCFLIALGGAILYYNGRMQEKVDHARTVIEEYEKQFGKMPPEQRKRYEQY